MNNYRDALTYLENLQKFGIKLGLDNIRALLLAAGSPERKLKFIHIAGSNGKGSCAAMLNAALRRCGFSCLLYSSPHLISPRERFRINGEAVSEEEFTRLVCELRPLAEAMAENGCCPTYFEFTTAMAAVCASKHKVDFVIWETGMGGRFDATNAVDPLCSVITSIALDHQQYLGDSPEKIAFEKAGIIKAGRPVIIGQMPPSVREVIVRKAEEVNALVLDAATFPAANLGFSVLNTVWLQKFDFDRYHVNLALPGAMQRENFRIVFTVLEYLAVEFGFSLAEALGGLEEAFWPARCQILPEGLIIDGGHNEAGIKILIESLREFLPESRIPVIFGSFRDKNTRECLLLLEPLAEYFVFMPLQTAFRASWSSEELGVMLGNFSQKKFLAADNPRTALALTGGSVNRLVCGSLYLAGEFLAELVPLHEVLDI
ncbi:MAG: bifunctional folylpolyglutamate synthase/dihydrofolate synthase [Victivallales bacterium]|nr:bifunctional folylpolyglutamate synthase/dihydrofolate synthase [Victivallales bacterium]